MLSVARLLLLGFLGWGIALVPYWYRPVVGDGAWVRCGHAPVIRQLYCSLCALLVPIGSVLWFKGDWRNLTAAGLGLAGTLGLGICGTLVVVTAEYVSRVVAFNTEGIRAHSVWGREVEILWARLVRVEYSAWRGAFVFHGAGGEHFVVPVGLAGIKALLGAMVRRTSTGVYFAARRRLDRIIPRLECEIQRSVARLESVGLAALEAPDDVIAPVSLSMAYIFASGLHAYYSSPLGELGAALPRALALLGAGQEAEVVAAANRAFGAAGPPSDQTERERALAAGAGALWQQLRRHEEQLRQSRAEFDALLRNYIDAEAASRLQAQSSRSPASA